MAEAAKDQDQSMEEILQSIKRIIAEEGDPVPADSDVLELTDMLAEDGSVSKATMNEMSAKPQIPMMSIDEIMAAPISSDPEAIAPAPQELPPAIAAPEPEPATMEPVAAVPDDSLLSDAARHASIAALRELDVTPPAPAPIASSAHFRSGATVEDLVVEALKPMLSDWLNANLPGLIERLVEKEIRKLSARS